MQQLEVVLDEGALDGDARFPSACAVIVGDALAATERIENLIHELSLQPSFQLELGAARFERVGFHHVEDNFLAKAQFKALLPRIDFEWWCSSNLDVGDDDPYDTLADQFRWITGRILQKYRGKRVNFVFEQNDRLRNHFASVVQSAATAAGVSSDLVTFSIGTKNNRILSIADYCIALASNAIKAWVEICCDTDSLHRRHQYRDFAAIEPLCSTLFAANYGKSVSNRTTRLADHSFFEVAGFHSPSCSQAGET